MVPAMLHYWIGQMAPGLIAGGRRGRRANAHRFGRQPGGRSGLVALRGRVPAVACLARRGWPPIRQATSDQPSDCGPRRGCRGPARSDQAHRKQDDLTASSPPLPRPPGLCRSWLTCSSRTAGVAVTRHSAAQDTVTAGISSRSFSSLPTASRRYVTCRGLGQSARDHDVRPMTTSAFSRLHAGDYDSPHSAMPQRWQYTL